MSESLRFCLVTTFYPPYHFGGDAIFVQRLAHAIAARGHSVDVVHSVDAYRLSRSAPRDGYTETQGVRRLPLQTPVPFLSTLFSHQFGSPGPYHRRLREILGSDRYDVIHFHNISLVGGPEVLCYGDCVKLYTTHEYWLVCPTHVLFKFDREACRSKECLLCTLRARRPPQLWRSTARARRCVARLDRLLIPSRFAMQRHSDEGILAAMEVLPHFVPVPREEPRRADGRDGSFLFVGRLEKLKGLQDLFPMLRAFPQAHLRIAGTGTYEAELRRMASDLPNVGFLGQAQPSRVAELYREALAVVVPSLCYEVFPLAAAEALAHGVPVVARRIGALAEIVEESGGGLLFESIAECRSAMEQLLASPALRCELGDRGRRFALEQWTEEVHLERYLELVRSLMKKRAASAAGVSAQDRSGCK
ncbi:MAG: glycosyltransferase family 4 protein [Gammaproteobacteria bacterium]|nr:glycosyltransferase family 4 protein [Gammaproteobacteria bacterium]MDH3410920.1 glycosyltransferase family 4 protein [Gammaproteobacteria bacterium]